MTRERFKQQTEISNSAEAEGDLYLISLVFPAFHRHRSIARLYNSMYIAIQDQARINCMQDVFLALIDVFCKTYALDGKE